MGCRQQERTLVFHCDFGLTWLLPPRLLLRHGNLATFFLILSLTHLAAFLCMSPLLSSPTATTSSGKRSGNPVLPVHAADPHIALLGNRYYIYASDAGVYSSFANYHAAQPGEQGAGFAAWSSDDLVHWRN